MWEAEVPLSQKHCLTTQQTWGTGMDCHRGKIRSDLERLKKTEKTLPKSVAISNETVSVIERNDQT